jgi:nucleoside-diphosphate-sugar epimerase
MKILVTGATGFIGMHLCRRLAADGHAVVALVRNREKAAGLPAGVESLEGDLSLFERTVTLPQCDVVVHLAGIVTAEKPEQYRAINYVAVRHLVECLERQTWRPKRLLFASSLAAAGPSASGRAKSEADPCEPIEEYGESKRDAEQFLQTAPFPTTSFRPALVMGEGDPATITLFRMAKRGLGFYVAGTNPKISFIDVEDLIDALMKLVADPSSEHRTYFASYSTPTDTRALWTAVGKSLGRSVVLVPIPQPALYAAMKAMTALARVFNFTNQLDTKQYAQITAPAFVCSSDALQHDFDWQPKHDLDACTARAAAGFRRAGWL